MSLDTITGQTPQEGSIPIPVAAGRYGMYDQVRQLETVLIGMAVSWKDSTDPADWRSYYKFGNALARSEFAGVVGTFGASPGLSIPASTTNADTSSVLFAGYAAVLLAPGEVVKKGQYLAPIPSGTYQGYFQVSASGPVESRQYASGGSDGVLVSANILSRRALSGLIAPAVGPSAALTGVTVETAYNKTVSIPANSLRVGDRLRIRATVLSNNGAAGANTVKVYINGIGSGVLATAPAVTFSASDVVQYEGDIYVSTTILLAQTGSIVAGTPGTATLRAVPGTLAVVLTSANVVTVTNTPNNIADSSTLQLLSVEKLG